MFGNTTRRGFIQSAAAAGGVVAGLGDIAFLSKLRGVSAQETRLDKNIVQLDPDIEPIVRLLEDTPRDQLLEAVAARIRDGLEYRQVLAALMLAGVRNVQPRPEVGFKFHTVLVVNSAHLASIASPEEHRWLPIFWALDYFKEAQAQDAREGNWTMSPVDESAVPGPDRAEAAFIEAMDKWDESAADAAAAGLARSAKPQQVFELFCRYGARDFRSIGHKAIYVANSWRTLNEIGWQHSEPILRSLAYALLKHDGMNPSQADAPPDRPGRENVARAEMIRDAWTVGTLGDGKPDEAATRDMLAVLRQGSVDDSCGKVVELLNAGHDPQTIWDALFVGSGELLARQPGIVALHAVTSTNALRFAFATTQDDQAKRMLLLQNAAFVPLFREAMSGRGAVGDIDLTQLEPAPLEGTPDEALKEICSNISQDRGLAARQILTYSLAQSEPKEFMDAARLLIFFKGTNSHDYKFSSAVLEDYQNVSPTWRHRFLAASAYNLRGSDSPDSPLVERTRSALSA